jgi:toxin YoeB
VRLCFTPAAWEDYLWFQQHDRNLLKRLNLLIRDALRSPFEGIGKPEPLKANLSGYWPRRINDGSTTNTAWCIKQRRTI